MAERKLHPEIDRLQDHFDYLEADQKKLRTENIRLRKACSDLATKAKSDFPCAVCGSAATVVADETPAGALCARCCPHPAEERVKELEKLINGILETGVGLHKICDAVDVPSLADEHPGVVENLLARVGRLAQTNAELKKFIPDKELVSLVDELRVEREDLLAEATGLREDLNRLKRLKVELEERTSEIEQERDEALRQAAVGQAIAAAARSALVDAVALIEHRGGNPKLQRKALREAEEAGVEALRDFMRQAIDQVPFWSGSEGWQERMIDRVLGGNR